MYLPKGCKNCQDRLKVLVNECKMYASFCIKQEVWHECYTFLEKINQNSLIDFINPSLIIQEANRRIETGKCKEPLEVLEWTHLKKK